MGFRAGSGTAEFYLIQLNNGVMECRLVTTAGFHEYVAPANTIIPQVWQHIAWIYDGTAILLYVNGILSGSEPASGIFQGETVTFAIGKSLLAGFNFVYGGGNNTSITHLICEIGDGERDAELMNFALTGPTSNFVGTLNPGYQAISFPQIPNHLTSDPPFKLEASATSGLPVSFAVIAGPATISNDTVYLEGNPGEVVIEATQPGGSGWDPADPVINAFMVLDPQTFVPEIDVRHPLAGDVYVPSLADIMLSTVSTIDYPELFSVSAVNFEINGQTIPATSFADGHYVAWWTPPDWGNYSLSIISKNNYGAAAMETININIVSSANDMDVTAADSIWLNPSNYTQVVSANLPSFLGAFDQVMGTLTLTCPPTGGCGKWDRVASVDVKGHNGQWYEIIRYITPYGVPCSHKIDLTDYISLLLGKVEFRFNGSTLDNGYVWALNFRRMVFRIPGHNRFYFRRRSYAGLCIL